MENGCIMYMTKEHVSSKCSEYHNRMKTETLTRSTVYRECWCATLEGQPLTHSLFQYNR